MDDRTPGTGGHPCRLTDADGFVVTHVVSAAERKRCELDRRVAPGGSWVKLSAVFLRRPDAPMRWAWTALTVPTDQKVCQSN